MLKVNIFTDRLSAIWKTQSFKFIVLVKMKLTSHSVNVLGGRQVESVFLSVSKSYSTAYLGTLLMFSYVCSVASEKVQVK